MPAATEAATSGWSGKVNELGAFAFTRAAGGDRAAVQLDEPFDEGEAEPEAAAAALDGLGRLHERLEEVLLRLGRHAGAVVTHANDGMALARLDTQDRLAASRRELRRVGQEVADDLGEARAIALDPQGPASVHDLQIDAAPRERLAVIFGGPPGDRGDVHALPLEDDLAP